MVAAQIIQLGKGQRQAGRRAPLPAEPGERLAGCRLVSRAVRQQGDHLLPVRHHVGRGKAFPQPADGVVAAGTADRQTEPFPRRPAVVGVLQLQLPPPRRGPLEQRGKEVARPRHPPQEAQPRQHPPENGRDIPQHLDVPVVQRPAVLIDADAAVADVVLDDEVRQHREERLPGEVMVLDIVPQIVGPRRAEAPHLADGCDGDVPVVGAEAPLVADLIVLVLLAHGQDHVVGILEQQRIVQEKPAVVQNGLEVHPALRLEEPLFQIVEKIEHRLDNVQRLEGPHIPEDEILLLVAAHGVGAVVIDVDAVLGVPKPCAQQSLRPLPAQVQLRLQILQPVG